MQDSMHTNYVAYGGQAVLPIEKDDTLCRLMAVFVYKCLFSTKRERVPLKEMGWEDSLIDEMSTMPIDDVAKILGGASSCMGVAFDHRKAAAIVNSYRARKRDENDFDYFILNGATPDLVRELFPKVNPRVLAQHRKRLGCESRGGRPPMPDAESTYAIYRAWKALCNEEPNLRLRYRRLKEQFPQFSLATLYTALESN